jgi:hypothetical protein
LWVTPAHGFFFDEWRKQLSSQGLIRNPPDAQIFYRFVLGSAIVDGVSNGEQISDPGGLRLLFAPTDFVRAQSDQFAFQHAMSKVGESKASAEAKYNAFVSDAKRSVDRKIAEAEAECGYNQRLKLRDAWLLMGMAAHAVSDSTSPAHRGYQPWRSPYHGIPLGGLARLGWLAWTEARPHKELETVDKAPPFLDETVRLLNEQFGAQAVRMSQLSYNGGPDGE